MTETQRFDYRVLARTGPNLAVVGDFQGRTADDAVRAAAEAHPQDDATVFIAIPLSKWHERSVTTKTQTVVEVGEVGA